MDPTGPAKGVVNALGWRCLSDRSDMARIREHYEANGQDVNTIIDDRITDDMRPFAFQIAQLVTHSTGALQRLAGTGDLIAQAPGNFAEADAMLRQALAGLDTFDWRGFEHASARKIVWSPVSSTRIEFLGGTSFLVSFVLPTFYFHLATAYAIARKNRVPVGKRDFLARGEPPALA